MAKTILLADDSVTIQKVVELTFMDQDYQVVATGNGTSALEQLSELGPDLVIADVHMPGADGYEVCRQTKGTHPEIPVLLLVGTFEQFDEAKAAEVGADGHLKKPFDSQDLLNQVETLIAHRARPDETSGASEAAAAPEADTDVFEVDPAPPGAVDLEPPSLEASATPAGDVWGAESPKVEAAPVVEPEAPTFATAPAPAFGATPEAPPAAPPPLADFDQAVADTAAVDLDAIERSPAVPESSAFELEESTDELPSASLAESATPAPEPAAPEPAASEPASPEPAAPVVDLEAPTLEAPPIEDFAPFDDPPVAAEPAIEEPVPFAMEPFPLPAAGEPAAEQPMAQEPIAEEPAVEEPIVDEPIVEEPIAEESAVEEPVVEEPIAEEPVVEEPIAEEPAVEEPVAAAATSAAAANGSGSLSDDDVERIARRVAELMGEKALRDVAWEVVPDLAEVIIKERIRELESQVV